MPYFWQHPSSLEPYSLPTAPTFRLGGAASVGHINISNNATNNSIVTICPDGEGGYSIRSRRNGNYVVSGLKDGDTVFVGTGSTANITGTGGEVDNAGSGHGTINVPGAGDIEHIPSTTSVNSTNSPFTF